MRKASAEIKLESYEDILGIGDLKTDQVVDIPLHKLQAFKNHPFHVYDDEKMQETVESIQRHGVLCPAIVRPKANGFYEIISGHRRKRGCELAGKRVLPALVRDYTDEEATIVMVDANIQREDILPSEKAWAYRMKMEAMRHQGIKGSDGETAELVGKKAGESGRTVQRYIRLTELLPELLLWVDDGMIKFMAGVHLSYLTSEEQGWVFQCANEIGSGVKEDIARQLKKYSEEKKLTQLAVKLLLTEKPEKPVHVTLKGDKIKKYFPREFSQQQIEEVIYSLLDEWKKAQ